MYSANSDNTNCKGHKNSLREALVVNKYTLPPCEGFFIKRLCLA